MTTKAHTKKSNHKLFPPVAKKKAAKKSNLTTITASAKHSRHIPADAKIIKVSAENPRRKGTFGFKSFAKIINNMTVSQYVERGGRMKDLRWDLQHGYVRIIGSGVKKIA
jgi:hypothetical protein